jgi:hypothetical protein
LLQQRLAEINHPDHTLITYPNLGHNFYPSNTLQTGIPGTRSEPISEYVLADLYSWLEDHSGFTSPYSTAFVADNFKFKRNFFFQRQMIAKSDDKENSLL